MACLRRVRECTQAVLVVKRGPLGCSMVDGEIPAAIDDALTVLGERIEVLNVLGAGDAFASGLLSGLLRGKDFTESARIANACGAIVVSRHGCAPAMPTPAELAHWFSGQRHPKPDQDPQLAHLHRVSAKRAQWPELYVLAYDHRSQFEDMARQAGADVAQVPRLKKLINQVVAEVESDPGCQGKLGVLIDGRLGEAALHDAIGRGWWVGRPIEQPGSRPLRFDGTHSLASQLVHWPLEQVVKCLVFYHLDDSVALRAEQDEWLQQVWEATRASGHELLLEVIAPKNMLLPGDNGESVVRSIRHFYDIGLKPEWWKVGTMAARYWQALEELVQERDPYCRGAVILGLSQPVEQLIAGFAEARSPLVKGFMIGRTVWASASLAWLKNDLDDAQFKAEVAANFRQLIAGWRASRIAGQHATEELAA
jgi:5-dehydro-2-deoxygluconokinase